MFNIETASEWKTEKQRKPSQKRCKARKTGPLLKGASFGVRGDKRSLERSVANLYCDSKKYKGHYPPHEEERQEVLRVCSITFRNGFWRKNKQE